MNNEQEIEILKRLENLEEYIQRQIKLETSEITKVNPNSLHLLIGKNSKIVGRKETFEGVQYLFRVGTTKIVIYRENCNQCYYHDWQLIKGEMNSIIDKIVQEYEKYNMSGKYTGDANKEVYVTGYDPKGLPFIGEKPTQPYMDIHQSTSNGFITKPCTLEEAEKMEIKFDCSPIEEEKRNSGCFEKVLINVPLIGNFKVKYKEPSDGKLFYGLVYEAIVKEFMLLDGVIYYQDVEVTNQCGKKVKQIINDYEAGLAKGEEKKDEDIYNGEFLDRENTYIESHVVGCNGAMYIGVKNNNEVCKIEDRYEGIFIDKKIAIGDQLRVITQILLNYLQYKIDNK